MNDFLSSIVERSTGISNDVRPRTPSMFEPIVFGNPSPIQPVVESDTVELQPLSSPTSQSYFVDPPQLPLSPLQHPLGNQELPHHISDAIPISANPLPMAPQTDLESRWDILDAKFRMLYARSEANDNSADKIIERVLVSEPRSIVSTPKPGHHYGENTIQEPFAEPRIPPLGQIDRSMKIVHEQMHSRELVLTGTSPPNLIEPITARQSPVPDKIPTQTTVPTVVTQTLTPSTFSTLVRPIPMVSAPTPKPNQPATHTVTVSIGRIELRGSESPKPTPAPTNMKTPSQSRVMSLEQYIAMRSKGELA